MTRYIPLSHYRASRLYQTAWWKRFTSKPSSCSSRSSKDGKLHRAALPAAVARNSRQPSPPFPLILNVIWWAVAECQIQGYSKVETIFVAGFVETTLMVTQVEFGKTQLSHASSGLPRNQMSISPQMAFNGRNALIIGVSNPLKSDYPSI